MIFIVTLPGGYRVGNDISAAAVQQAMAGAGGSCREVAFFDEAVGNAAQRQISGNAAAGGSAADNNNISFNHVILFFFLPVHGALYGLLPVVIEFLPFIFVHAWFKPSIDFPPLGNH